MRRNFPAIAVALTSLACAPHAIRAQNTTALDPTALRVFVDSVITAEMARERIPGAAFVFVQNGRVVVQRGYGLANVAAQRAVNADSTIWRIGSISKVFTATAAMQLVDRGRIDLDAPADRYLRRVSIPQTYPEAVTVRHMLTHSAGFDEIRPGTQGPSRDAVLPLDRFLATRLVRIRPPGKTTAYSTYGITLAGELIEEVSGLSFEDYLRRNIWEPLGMRRASIDVLGTLKNHVAIGYEMQNGSLVPQAWEWYHTTPASSVNATAADMGRFIIAHLGSSAGGAARMLSARALQEMHRQQITMHPSIPGFAIGFYEDYAGDLRVIEHGGNVAGFSALMVLIPSERAGFFVVNHFEGSSLRDNLKWSLLEKFFPAARARRPVPANLPSVERVRPERFTGNYMPLIGCFTCNPRRAGSDMTLTANADGTLGFAGGRWIAVDSLRFVRENGTGYIVFRADSAGAIRELFAGAFWGWQKLPQ